MTGYAALLGGLGLVAIGFSLLIAIISAFQPVADLTWVWGNLVVGVVLLASALVSGFDTLRERLATGEGRRASKYGTSALLNTLLGIAILAMLAFLSTRYATHFDWTEQKVHTLTDQSLKLLHGLEQDVQVTAFFRELDAPPARELLERYEQASPHFVVQFMDPNARPDLVQQYGLDESKLGQGLVRLALGEDSVEVTDLNEGKITNALVQLTRSSDKKIYFVTGHNERVIEGEGADGKEGMQEAAQALRNENYQVATLLIAEKGDVPADADAVVIAGPTRPLPEEELAPLRSYVEKGGALLAMVDPRANTNLPEFLKGFGVSLDDDIIVDLELAFFQQYMSPFAASFDKQHAITKDMDARRNPTLFYAARSVDAPKGGPFKDIVFTGENSWAERDLADLEKSGRVAFGPGDQKGPVGIVAAGELPAPKDVAAAGGDDKPAAQSRKPRVVVIGDSDFATNEFVVRYGGNRDLFVNSVNWLLGDVEAISVRPHQSRASRFTGSEEEVRAIQYLSLFVLPEAIAVLGVLAWWWRRKSPGR